MKKRNSPKKENPPKLQYQRDPIRWRYCFLTLMSGLILVAGFFFAARQHFSAIDLGMKNATLRRQKDELENDQRRLYLAREVSFSPAEIKKAAKKIGLQEFASNAVEAVSRKVETAASSAAKFADQKQIQGFLPKSAETKEEKSKSEKVSSKDDKETKPKTANLTGDNIRPRVIGK